MYKALLGKEYNEDSVKVVQCGGGSTEREREIECKRVLLKQGWYRRFCPKKIAGVSGSVGVCVCAYKGCG